MAWFAFGLTSNQKERFNEFQKNRRPSMKVIGRGTLTISIEDAREIRKQKNSEATQTMGQESNLQIAR